MPVRCIVEINTEGRKPVKQIFFEGERETLPELKELSELLSGASMKVRVIEWTLWEDLKKRTWRPDTK